MKALFQNRTENAEKQTSAGIRFLAICLFYSLLFTLASFAVQACNSCNIYPESFPNKFNTGFTRNYNSTFTGSMGAWTTTSNPGATVVVTTPYYNPSTSYALKIVNWRTDGVKPDANTAANNGIGICSATSPSRDMATLACTNSATIQFTLWSYNCNSGDNMARLELMFSGDNGATWVTGWTKTSGQMFTSYGANGKTTITVPIVPSVLTGTFKYKFVGTSAQGNTKNFYLFIDDIGFCNGSALPCSVNISPVCGSLTCSNSTATLSATASPVNGVTYLWTPGGQTTSSITVTSAGSYSVRISNSCNGCSATSTATVTDNRGSGCCSNITNAGTIGSDESICGNFDPLNIQSLTLPSGGSGTIEYAWQMSTNNFTTFTTISGASGSSYDPAAITVTTWYRRIARRTNCTAYTGESNIIKKEVKTRPSVSINNAVVDCAHPSATLTATPSMTNGTTYLWSVGGQTSSSITTTSGGTYNVTITNNGCTATASSSVSENRTAPTVTINSTNNAVLTCNTPSVNLSAAASPSTGAMYSWTPGGQTTSAITTSTTGNFCVTLTNTTNGCTATACVGTTDRRSNTTVSVNNAALNCSVTSAQLIANGSPASDLTYAWSTGGQTSSTINVTSGGTYRVTVTNTVTGCTSSATGNVTQDITPPQVNVNNLVLDCRNTDGLLTATQINNMTYRWSSSNETTCSIRVSNPGSYCVTVKNPSNGCTASAFANVTLNNTPPTVSVNDAVINCNQNSARLSATTSQGANLEWSQTGESTPTISVSATGNYCVVVTNPSNGCTASACGSVTSDLTQPSVTVNDIILNCTNPSGTLQASASQGVTYNWNNGAATTSSINVTSSGNYCVTVQNNSNGCIASACRTITKNITPPSVTVNDAVMNCNNETARLTASGNQGTTYEWNSGEVNPSITVSASGSYCVTATNPLNGCTASACGFVSADFATPAGSINNLDLDCRTTSGQLTAVCTSPSAPVYNWSHNGATSSSVSVSGSGQYCVTITNPSNGCNTRLYSNVTIHNSHPSVSVNDATLSCLHPVASLLATVTAESNVSYNWSEGGETTSSISPDSPGMYCVTVTNLSNGCHTTVCANVTEDNSVPTVSVNNGILTCSNSVANLTATTSYTTGLVYDWSPGGQTSKTISVNEPGDYCVTVTNMTNGCSVTSYNCAHVTTDLSLPTVSVSSAILTCTDPTSILQVTTVPENGLNINWNDGSGSSKSHSVSAAGNYCVTVTNPQNGCSVTSCGNVTMNNTPPSVTVNDAALTCHHPSNTLSASVNGNANYTYMWDANGQTTSSIQVSTDGSYCVNVTNPSNGCASSACGYVSTVVVPINVTVNSGLALSCNQPTGTLTATCNSAIPNPIYYWYPGGQHTSSVTVSQPGTYTVTVFDYADGCYNSASTNVVVGGDKTAPSVNLPNAVITCTNPSVTLNAASNSNCTYRWANSNQTTPSISVSAAGNYCVTVTNPENGCARTICSEVFENRSIPVVTVNNCSITCGQPTATITASCPMSQGLIYNWSPGGETTSSITTSTAGTYTVRVIDQSNGCNARTTSTVTLNNTPPAISCSSTNGTCTNGNVGTATVTVNNPNQAYRYNWSNGSTSQSIIDLPAGTYTVSVKDEGGCISSCTANISRAQDCCSNLTSGGQISSDETNCGTYNPEPISSVSLPTGGSGTMEYAWQISFDQFATYTQIAGAIDASFDPAPISRTTWYRRIARRNGCQSYTGYSNIVMKQVKLPATASISNDGPLSFCRGGNVNLCATGGITYSWNIDANTSCINAINTGTYTVTVTNIDGCTATASMNVNLIPSPTVQITGSSTICIEKTTTLCVLTDGISYQWNNGLTNSCLTTGFIGTYTVTAVNAAGCTASASRVTVSGKCPIISPPQTRYAAPKSDIIESGMSVTAYPNPFNDKVMIQFELNENAGNVQLDVFTPQGKKVATLYNSFADTGIKYEVSLNGNDLPSGMYIYKLVTATTSSMGQLMLIK